MSSALGDDDVSMASAELQNTPVLDEVVQEARSLRDGFLKRKSEETRARILNRSGIWAANTPHHTCDVSKARDRLERIIRRKEPCVMPAAEKPGAYIAWVPMYGYNQVTELDEPYMPYFGDEGLAKAQGIYEAMCKDLGPRSAFDLPSDGELELPHSTPRKKSRNRELPNDLRSLRLREAQRHSILKTVDRYGQHDYVWHALAHALRIRNVSRVHGMYAIATKRRAEVQEKRCKREQRDEHTKLVMDALDTPESVTEYPPFIGRTRVPSNDRINHFVAPSRHFCFVCWVFGCKVHDPRETVEPIEPIPDLNTDNRIEQLNDGAAKPCSQKCYLLEDWLQQPTDECERDEWTAEEEWLLREAVPIFRNDPCSLALAIGSRPCRAVKKKLEPKEYQLWIEETVRSERRGGRNLPDPFYRQQLKKAQRAFAAEKKQEKKNTRKNGKEKSVRARKSCCNSFPEPATIVEHARYVPCNHPGPCVEGEKNCICVLKNTHCQSRCGCNGARLTESKTGKIEWKGKDCGRGATGCSCRDGNCLGDTCVCAGDLVACNPDICTCDCRNLEWDPQARKCRNVDAIYPRHKRTYVGKSKYNLGLFAGERFKKGDLVGVYFGNVIGEELIEQAIRVGQEMNSTYAMDLTDDLSIDALQMGSKVRYVNHASSVDQGVNCECKFVSIRGDPRAILRTTRTVEPGQEFYFDYKLTHTEGNDWLWKGKH